MKLKITKQGIAVTICLCLTTSYIVYDNLDKINQRPHMQIQTPQEEQQLEKEYVNEVMASVKNEVYKEMDEYIIQYVTENDITNYFSEESIQNLTQEITNVIVSDGDNQTKQEFEQLISDTIAQINFANYQSETKVSFTEETKAYITNQVASTVEEQLLNVTFTYTLTDDDKASITSDLNDKITDLEEEIAVILSNTDTETKPVTPNYELTDAELERLTEYVKSNLNISEEIAKYFTGVENQEIDIEAVKGEIATVVTANLSAYIDGIVKGENGADGVDGYTPVKGVDYFTQEEINSMIDEIASQVQAGADGADGVDGYTPVKGIDYFTQEEIEGIVNQIKSQVQNGTDGADGYTPVKGVDYFTPEEIANLVETVQNQVQNGTDGTDGLSAYEIAVEEGFVGTRVQWLNSLHGTNGVDGYTPVKGVDYFTDSEIDALKSSITNTISTTYDAVIEDLQDQINEVSTQVEINKTAIASLNTSLSSLSSELAELSVDVEANQERIEEISGEIDGINIQIENLETTTEGLEVSKLDISTFTTYKTNTDNVIASISENVSNLQSNLDTLKTNTQSHFDTIDAALDTFVGDDEFTEFSDAYTVFKNGVNQTLKNLETTCSSLGSTKLNITDFESYQAEEIEKINEIIANLDDNTLLLGTTDFATSDYSTVSDAIVSIQNEIDVFYEEYGNTTNLINEDIEKINNTIGNKTGLFEEYAGTLWQLANELQTNINENASNIGLAQSDINDINTELASFKSDVNISLANINGDITAINDELETKLDITTFETYQTTVDATLASLQSSIDELNTALGEETQIREDADTTITTNLENLQNAWDSFKGSSTLTLTDIESFMANTNNSIDELNSNLDDINDTVSNLATIEYSGAEVQIGKNLYKKLLIFDGMASGVWTSVGYAPTGAKNTRIDFGNSYSYYPTDGYIYPLENKALGTMARLNNKNREVQIYCENAITFRSVVTIVYNK